VHDVDASDVVFVGELRHLKGVDVLLEALAMVNRTRRVTATIVGAGPDVAQFKAQATKLGLEDVTRFPGVLPARAAFKMGHALIMPSRAESFPYIVLEAGAAGLPLIATRVGGIPEITGDSGTPLIAPGDVEALAAALFDALDSPEVLQTRAQALQQRIASRFNVDTMTTSVMSFYAHTAALSVGKATSGRSLLTTD
jgi:glycosyltransferase involved in cell wall biosynthesis